MKLILEPAALEMFEGVQCRRWEGVTDKGVPVHAWIRSVSPQTHDPDVNAEFARDLQEHCGTYERQVVMFDMILVL